MNVYGNISLHEKKQTKHHLWLKYIFKRTKKQTGALLYLQTQINTYIHTYIVGSLLTLTNRAVRVNTLIVSSSYRWIKTVNRIVHVHFKLLLITVNIKGSEIHWD